MKYLSFNTLWNKAKEYINFDANDHVDSYNCFMWALEENALKVEGDDFDIKKFNFFMLSWRHTARQASLNHGCSPKQICKRTYDAYMMPAPQDE
ncbi:hypothetical protein ABEG10_13700 [Burkholderia cenocepacia]|uniref:hypothetical protein n=1 Tax=Burkholderia cepacia complex TaxID=87882 RepID=UPI00209C8774|nr:MULTISPECIES: hypothetical protein [Burkholderia cepacia complex]MCO8354309.1 hypothetical protein [Burkholderia multivorans]MCO8386931.1 hypothetical protein [Burkholderia multivorans]MCO8406370.1 hypothetical protein [Burkholderia multivorans]MCO8421436.1 hypothetical protein [Burkholderia cenocepacia]MCO8435656.1 hypothetical protein [Burkholderia multivorans]